MPKIDEPAPLRQSNPVSIVGMVKPMIMAAVAIGLMVVWAIEGHFLLAACVLSFFLLPISGGVLLHREKRPWVRALIATTVVAGFALVIWQFILALL